MVDGILDGLRWLGLDCDEGPLVGGTYGPYFQSERGNRYRAMAARLVAEAVAYYCYCKDEVCRCRELTPEIVADRERDGLPRASRFQCRSARCASTISSTGRSCSRA